MSEFITRESCLDVRESWEVMRSAHVCPCSVHARVCVYVRVPACACMCLSVCMWVCMCVSVGGHRNPFLSWL